MSVDRQMQEYYENQFDMFSHKGWADLIEDMQSLYDAINDLASVEDENTLFFRKGQADILNLLFDRKQACENAWQELNG